jgi:multidrug efflux system membrane fusion protein
VSLSLVALAFAVVAASCGGEGQATLGASSGGGRGGGKGGAEAVPVTTATAVQKPMPVNIDAVGTAEAISTVQVRSQVTGQLLNIHFAEGQEVREGQLLFTIDPQPFQVALNQATAVLTRDTAQANNAKVEADRYQNLLQRGLIPRDQADAQTANAAALAGSVAADQAAIDAAKLNLQRTTINSPVTGRTGSLQAHPGDLVQANGATPLVVINQLSPIYVTFSVPGNILDDVRRFQAIAPLKVVTTSPGAGEVSSVAGQVTFIDNAVDIQTGTIKLKATFPNTGHVLWPGEFTQVTLQLRTEPRAVVVPSQAVQSGQQGSFVYVVTGNSTAEVRPVSVARVQGDESVIASGINAGDTVVVDGQLRLTPGARVLNRPPVGGAALEGAAE